MSQATIDAIKRVKEIGSSNIETISTSQWYNALIECEFMDRNENVINGLKLTREERAFPNLSWDQKWRRARVKVLGSEAYSFLWRMMHDNLPTEARLSWMNLYSTENCKYCPVLCTADVVHCLLDRTCPLEEEIKLSNIFIQKTYQYLY